MKHVRTLSLLAACLLLAAAVVGCKGKSTGTGNGNVQQPDEVPADVKPSGTDAMEIE